MKRLTLVLLLSAACYGQSITFKDYKEATPTGSASTIATTVDMNIATNDAMFACVGRGFGATAVSSIVDNNGGANSFTLVKHADSGVGDSVGGVDLWMKTGATANATARFTATLAGASDFRWLAIGQFSGVATSSANDQSSCNSAGCATATTASVVTAQNVTTTQANELLAACNYNNNQAAIWSGQNSFTLATGAANLDHQFMYKVVASTGSYPGGNMADLNATSVGQVTAFGTFKQAGAGSTPRKRVMVTQ